MFVFLVLAVLSGQGAARAPPCAFDGRGYTDMKVTSPSGRELDATSCQKACQLEPTCNFFTYYNNSHMCWLMGKSATLMDQPDPKATSGAKSCTSGVGPGAAITITGDATPDEVAAGVAAEAAAAGAPLEPLAVEEIHRNAEAAYGRIMDQVTKVDMRVVSNKLRGRKKTTTYWEGNYVLMVFFFSVYAGFLCVALYQGWLERIQREQQEMEAKLSPPQDLESGSEFEGASPSKAFGISGTSTSEKKVQESTAYEGPVPTKDKILWFLLFGYFFIFLTVSALLLLLPLLLEYESYGLLDPNDVERSRERLASATSMVMIPNGVSNLVFSTVGFLIVSNVIGDVKTMRLGAFIASVMLCLYGFVATEVWHLLILHSSMGIGLGLFVPALGPTLQRYSTLAHPKKAAQASALPLFGMQLGQVVGQPIFGAIVGDSQDRNRMNIAWLVAGICFALGAVTMDLSMMLIHRHPVMKRLKYTPEQVQIMIETGAKEQDVFVEEMCKKLRGMLTEGHPDFRGARLWSGVAQRFIERVIDRSIPKLREGPEEHLEDVALWLSKVGDEKEMEWFRKRFPQIRLPQDRATDSTSTFPSSPAPKDYA